MVETQGRHLVARPNTPVYTRSFDPEFVRLLESGLGRLNLIKGLREFKYGQAAADEWLRGHTPTELREEYSRMSKARLAAMYEGSSTSDSDHSDVEDAQSRTSKKQITSLRSSHEERQHLLVSPSLSNSDSPSSKPSIASSNTSHGQLELPIPPDITSKATRGTKRRYSETDNSEIEQRQTIPAAQQLPKRNRTQAEEGC